MRSNKNNRTKLDHSLQVPCHFCPAGQEKRATDVRYLFTPDFKYLSEISSIYFTLEDNIVQIFTIHDIFHQLSV